MRNSYKRLFFTGIVVTLSLHSCMAPVPVAPSPVTRPVDRQTAEWSVVGAVRVETLTKLPISVIPYDALLKEAQKKYGETVDIIEIKEDKLKLDPRTKAEIAKETKNLYSYRYIYNALVIQYK